jgi:hypothetical protein
MASVLGVAKLKEIITPAPSSATWALVQLWAPHVLQLLWDGEGSDGDYGRNNFAQKACEQCKKRRQAKEYTAIFGKCNNTFCRKAKSDHYGPDHLCLDPAEAAAAVRKAEDFKRKQEEEAKQQAAAEAKAKAEAEAKRKQEEAAKQQAAAEAKAKAEAEAKRKQGANAVSQSLPPALATCSVVGCSRMSWNGKINEQCCRTCKSSNGACHGPECEKRAADGHQHSHQTFHFASELYHATSLEAALRIQAEGFRVPNGPSQQKAGALLGPGVYASATLQKAIQYCDGPEGGIVFQLAVDLGKCITLKENDPMMTTWQQHGYDSAWAPTGAGGRGAGLEENCMKDPKRIKIVNAIAVHTTKLEQAGYKIEECGKIVKVK